MLKVVSLRTGYGALQVIDGISLSVQRGEVVALLGANGAGKSTLMKAIAGLLPPGEGRVFLDGRSVAGCPAERIAALGLTMVPEGRGLFPGMTALENLRMGGYARKLKGKALAQHISDSVDLFPALHGRLGERAGNFSGGQQQMLAIAKALVGSPDILLLDEPSTGLAPLLVAEVYATIARLKTAGVTILLAEQNVQHALNVADRAYVIENGRVALTAPAAELLASDEVTRVYLGM